MDNRKKEEKKPRLLFKFAVLFVAFILICLIACGVLTYVVQMKTYKELKCGEIRNVSGYLTTLMQDEGQRFIDYKEYYEKHYKDMIIPYDFKDPGEAYNAFLDAFSAEYPGKTLYYDIYPDDLSEELKLLYFTYVHECWTIIFEQARVDFDIPYTYFLTMDETTYYATYMIDGERIPDAEREGFIYLGDNYYEDPMKRGLLWRTWFSGEKQNEYYEWNNQWGNTYSYYTPLIINGEELGLVCAEVDVHNVNAGILKTSFMQFIPLGFVLIFFSLILLVIINKNFVYKINYLSEKVEDISGEEKAKIARDIREQDLGNDEIGILADGMSDMLERLETHENEVEYAARLKSDFLANMSHEIRTPMNAVIGMTDLILREDIPKKVQNYASQIKDSGSILLTIINDILDFSRIESGNLEIVNDEYSPMDMINDVSNIIMNRLSDKSILLDLDYDPSIPTKLYGDENRIRQVLINLANNAVKFTNKGYIRIHVGFKKADGEYGTLNISVEDTGIGIRKEDKAKLFESFSQLDSKRNRNVEGNGLGLAISRRLVKLMNGTISVESEYNVGSTFSFSLPQKVVDSSPSVIVNNPSKVIAVYCFSNEFSGENFERDTQKLGVRYICASNDNDPEATCSRIEEENPGKIIFLFFDHSKASEIPQEIFIKHKRVVPVIVADFTFTFRSDIKRLILAPKPISTFRISQALNNDKPDENEPDDIRFIAPDASVLIVDDNQVNHVIAEGLMQPLKMNIVKAMSGSEAIKYAGTRSFDMILMDHMMPGMDGVEAMNIIREKYPEYVKVPIIALTANALEESKKMLLEAGMDDFIAKPIGANTLLAKIRQWLPPEKIRPVTEEESGSSSDNVSDPVIGDLDVAEAVSMLGSRELFIKILTQYHHFIPKRCASIKASYEAGDWENYTIEVHSLKSTSGQIGAGKLQKLALALENAGKERNLAYIREHTQEMLDLYSSYESVIAPFCDDKDNDADGKLDADKEVLLRIFNSMKEAADDLDLGGMEKGVDELSLYSFPEDQKAVFAKLKEAVSSIEAEECTELLNKWEAML
ncbi:MAG: response regulator [Lachnospiraceae bacterium]|nr:response regulator [Lachnospiraceae bacterium]